MVQRMKTLTPVLSHPMGEGELFPHCCEVCINGFVELVSGFSMLTTTNIF
jgi:hypothetical protein